MTTLPAVASYPVAYSGEDGDPAPLFFDVRTTLISQYANSPVLISLVRNLGQAIDRQAGFDTFYHAVWDIASARGFGLDIWGRIVGVGRAIFVPDNDYLGYAEAANWQPFGYGVWYDGGRATPNYLLTDTAYRQVIMAKAALNITNGSIPAINAILMALFPAYGNSYVRDNADMTMTFVFGSAPSTIDYAIVTQSGVLPRPCGVSFTVETS